MFPKEVHFILEENSYCEFGWRYGVRTDNSQDWWYIDWWKEKPSEEQVKYTKFLILRGMEFYHKSIVKPPFTLEIDEDII